MLVIVSDVKHYNYKVAIFPHYLLADKDKEAADCASASIQ